MSVAVETQALKRQSGLWYQDPVMTTSPQRIRHRIISTPSSETETSKSDDDGVVSDIVSHAGGFAPGVNSR